MFSEEVNVVFGFEPSGLLEKIILAPEIGTPRSLTPPRVCVDESGLEVVVTGLSVSVVVGGASFLGTFGTLIFGTVIVNWPIAGSVRNEVIAMAAIRIRDLVINTLLKSLSVVVRREIF
jgi:hypothetical protein